MEKITWLPNNLLRELQAHSHLAHLTLIQGEMFGWGHTACAISYSNSTPDWEAYLLHEAGHAILAHNTYTHDIELLGMERAAWDEAIKLAPNYGLAINSELIEDALDTYRDWLHARSLCPQCNATGIETNTRHYACLACRHEWRVNEARTCALRRYGAKK